MTAAQRKISLVENMMIVNQLKLGGEVRQNQKQQTTYTNIVQPKQRRESPQKNQKKKQKKKPPRNRKQETAKSEHVTKTYHEQTMCTPNFRRRQQQTQNTANI
eukprot:m.218895 g.218895  ORF g.218895 m.218895 type:complete len:103 (-) comp33279_c1_seq1:193-501(-)